MKEEKTYYIPKQAAEYINHGESTLAKYRMSGIGPKYIKAGPKKILYDREDLDAWLDSQKRNSTSEQ